MQPHNYLTLQNGKLAHGTPNMSQARTATNQTKNQVQFSFNSPEPAQNDQFSMTLNQPIGQSLQQQPNQTYFDSSQKLGSELSRQYDMNPVQNNYYTQQTPNQQQQQRIIIQAQSHPQSLQQTQQIPPGLLSPNMNNFDSQANNSNIPNGYSNTNFSQDQEQFNRDLLIKNQQMTEKLKYLENYRVICERRIKELAPQHPIPVLPSHIGQPNPDVEELRNKIRFSQNQYDVQQSPSSAMDIIKLSQRVDFLQQEKLQIEEALRNETLANEEQRNYIQILRNAIDQKMEGLGLGDLLSHRQLKGSNQDPITVYTIMSEMKRELDGWKRECKTNEEKVKLNDEQIRQEHVIQQNLRDKLAVQIQQSEKLQNQLEQTQNELSDTQDKFTATEEEKNQLLDYVEENVKQIDLLGKELEETRVNVERINEDRDQLRLQKQVKDQTITDLNEEISSLEQTKAQLQDQSDKFKDQIRTLKRENENRQAQIENLSTQNQDLQALLTQSQTQSEEKSQQIDQLKQQVRQLEQDIIVVSKEKERISEEKQIIEKRARIEEESLRKRIHIHEENAKQQEDKKREIEFTLNRDIDDMKRQHEIQLYEATKQRDDFKDKNNLQDRILQDYKRQKEQVLEENKQLREQINQTTELISQKAMEVNELKERQYESTRDTEALNGQFIQLEEQFLNEQQRREWLSVERERLANQVEELKTKLDEELSMNENFSRKVPLLERELDQQRLYYTKELCSKTDEITGLLRESDNLHSELAKYTQQLDFTRGTNQDIEQRLLDLTRDYDTLIREKRILEQQYADLKQENDQFFKLEEKTKKFIEENEIMKSQIRHKDRDISVLEDKFGKLSGELELADKEKKRIHQELSEAHFTCESGERLRCEVNAKLKDTEKRLYEMHKEKQEIEARFRAVQSQLQDVNDDLERVKKYQNDQDQEKVDMQQIINKFRGKCSEQTLLIEGWSKMTDELEYNIQGTVKRAIQFIDELLKRLGISEILSELFTRHTKEQLYLLKQSFDTFSTLTHQEDKLKSLNQITIDLKNFTNLALEQFDVILDEVQLAKQDNKLMEKKIEQLENRVGSQHTHEQINTEKQRYLSNEMENYKTQKQQIQRELQQVKDQDMQSQSKIKELQQLIQKLNEENNQLNNQIYQNDQQKQVIDQQVDQTITNLESSKREIVSKDLKIKQLSKEKRVIEEFLIKIQNILLKVNVEVSKLVEQIHGSIQERLKEELNKTKAIEKQNELEQQLSNLVINTDRLTSQEQALRSEINDLASQVRSHTQRIESLVRKESNLDAELKIYTEKLLIKQFTEDQHQTITYLMKESQDLKNELKTKNQQIFDFQSTQKKSTNVFESRNNTQVFSATQSINMADTLDRNYNDQNTSSKLAALRNGTLTKNSSYKSILLQPIKVDTDYDQIPSKQPMISDYQNQENYNTNNDIGQRYQSTTSQSIRGDLLSNMKPLRNYKLSTTRGNENEKTYEFRSTQDHLLSPSLKSHQQSQHKVPYKTGEQYKENHVPRPNSSYVGVIGNSITKTLSNFNSTQKGPINGSANISTPLQARLHQIKSSGAALRSLNDYAE
eukprot:403333074